MIKQWKKNHGNSFTFFVEDEEIGSIDFEFANINKVALFKLDSSLFSIKRKGFWNSTLLIADSNEQEVAKLYAAKWFANNWVLEYGGKNYQLSVRNNPLAEYVIKENENELIAYGLDTAGGNVQVKITDLQHQSDYMFDFLLWFLFAPVAVENMGDNLAFTLLLNQ